MSKKINVTKKSAGKCNSLSIYFGVANKSFVFCLFYTSEDEVLFQYIFNYESNSNFTNYINLRFGIFDLGCPVSLFWYASQEAVKMYSIWHKRGEDGRGPILLLRATFPSLYEQIWILLIKQSHHLPSITPFLWVMALFLASSAKL